ncbi:IcmT/TraK family protein [Photorhabdus asymbiotica]|uniref:IcmT/TraK family protein n=1 Tax=Photorhabdus asymbiotica TaxID=291112 RepID=UPI003DA79D61
MEINRWRNAAKPMKIFGVSWGWYLLIFTWFFHMTFIHAFLVILWLVFLVILNYKKLSLSLLFGKARCWLRGNHLTGRPWWMRKN